MKKQKLILTYLAVVSCCIFLIGCAHDKNVAEAEIGLTKHLVGHWKMDDNAANTIVIDSSGKGNGGAAQRDTKNMHAEGHIGAALEFDGSSDYVNCGNNSDLLRSTNFSISAWVKLYSLSTETNVGQVVVANYLPRAGFIFYLQGIAETGGAKLGLRLSPGTGGDALSPDSLVTGKWYHIVAIYNGQTSKVFVNGVLKSSASYEGASNGINFVIGKASWANISYFHGLIDNVMLFDTSLSQEEILLIYNNGRGRETL